MLKKLIPAFGLVAVILAGCSSPPPAGIDSEVLPNNGSDNNLVEWTPDDTHPQALPPEPPAEPGLTTPAPTPAPPVTTTTIAPTPPPPPTAPETSGPGTTVGSQHYAVPSNAIVVSRTGNNSNAGNQQSPYRSIQHAINQAASGATVVIRGGEYHESVIVPASKRVTIQNWPGETVWLDGSVVTSGWVKDGNQWRLDGWNTVFDSSPTYTRGAPDNSAPGWGFVNANHPMAAHPDQVWVNNVAQRQVQTRQQVTNGTFFYDTAGQRLYLGTNPDGAEVRAAKLIRAMSIRSQSSTLQGIGIRRYSPSVPDMGAVTIEAARISVNHVAVLDSATTGINISAPDVQMHNITVSRSGLVGINATRSDRLQLLGIQANANNSENFNQSPVSGGIKIGRTRTVVVQDSEFIANIGPGVWFDEEVHNLSLISNVSANNAGHGASLEISAVANVIDNIFANNTRDGIKVNNTSHVDVWNNTFVGNGRSINLVQDTRRPVAENTPGRDRRQPFPDPTMTWLLGPVRVSNNIISYPTSGNCLLCVEDYSHQRTAEQIGVTAQGNVYNRQSGSPTWLVVWSRGGQNINPYVFQTLQQFRTTTQQESLGHLIEQVRVVSLDGRTLTSAMPAATSAVSLPNAQAQASGLSSGLKWFGSTQSQR